jgi:hypothetical protein
MHHRMSMNDVTRALDKQEKESYSMPMLETLQKLNHVCCVCQASLDGKPLNPELQTSHGYCNKCLEVELSKIGGHNA